MPPSESRTGLEQRAAAHAALGDSHRLTVLDALLVSDRSFSELVSLTVLPSNLLAHHLEVLEQAGMVEQVRSSGDRRRRYWRLRRDRLEALRLTAPALSMRTVLFVCTENSARSQLAAAIWNASALGHADSAGTHPAERVHPLAVKTAARHGIDLSTARPRSVSQRDLQADLIVTVCDRAHEDLFLKHGAETLHWTLPDPAAAGTKAAFDQTYRLLEQRIETIAAA